MSRVASSIAEMNATALGFARASATPPLGYGVIAEAMSVSTKHRELLFANGLGATVVGMTSSEVLAAILRLPEEERAKLALELLRSLDGEPEPGAGEAWDKEIDRRAAEVVAGTADTMTLDEYRAHVRKRRTARARQ